MMNAMFMPERIAKRGVFGVQRGRYVFEHSGADRAFVEKAPR
jgi:hypothetical protein